MIASSSEVTLTSSYSRIIPHFRIGTLLGLYQDKPQFPVDRGSPRAKDNRLFPPVFALARQAAALQHLGAASSSACNYLDAIEVSTHCKAIIAGNM